MNLEIALKEYFNYPSFRMGQKEIIQAVLENKNTLAMLPTGTGKSLCFELPGYLMPGSVLIVSPLLSLMQDQVEQMMGRGEKRVVAINSFLHANERKRVLSRLSSYKYIFISPEMLQVPYIFQKIKALQLSLFVVDEAHCISQWGYDFRLDYQRLGEIRERLHFPTTLALTATATAEVREDICQTLRMNDAFCYVASVDRPNIVLIVERMEREGKKLERLEQLLHSLPRPGIIYFSSKKRAEQITAFLSEKGFQGIAYYHGGMDTEQRILIQQQFINEQLQIICATSAFGMGLNKEDVRFVIHYHPPLQLESYIQEIGRAGRDGKNSLAILFSTPDDTRLQIQLIESEFPTEEQVDKTVYMVKQSHLTKTLAENKIAEEYGLTENQWRFLQHFLYEGDEGAAVLSQKIKDYIRDRKQLKQQKIVEMTRWITTNHCRRKNILNYFAETRKIEVEPCCDICGIKMENVLLCEEPEGNQQQVVDESVRWQEKLASLLTPKRS